MTHNSVGGKLARPPRLCLESRKGGKQIGSSRHVLGGRLLTIWRKSLEMPLVVIKIIAVTLGGAVCRKEDFRCLGAPFDEIVVGFGLQERLERCRDVGR